MSATTPPLSVTLGVTPGSRIPMDDNEQATMGRTIVNALYANGFGVWDVDFKVPMALPADPEMDPMIMRIKVENAYVDGHESTQFHEVTTNAGMTDDDLQDLLFEYTGDGHGVNLEALYVVTIVECGRQPELVGKTFEWQG